MAPTHTTIIIQLRWWGCTETGVEASSFQIPGCSLTFTLRNMEWSHVKKKYRESYVMGVPGTGCYTKRNPRMVCSWGHMELPWQCCKMAAHFHNPPSAILLNSSHKTFLSSLKWHLPRTWNATVQLLALTYLSYSCHQRSVTAALTS